MNRFEYIVESIDGDYAHLRRTDIESDELKLVARALLPPEIMEGTKLLYEWMQYSIMVYFWQILICPEKTQYLS